MNSTRERRSARASQEAEAVGRCTGGAAEKREVTLDQLTEMTFAAYRLAIEHGSTKGADTAVEAVAQLSRMHGYVGKRPNERVPIEDLTADERNALRVMVEEAPERPHVDDA